MVIDPTVELHTLVGLDHKCSPMSEKSPSLLKSTQRAKYCVDQLDVKDTEVGTVCWMNIVSEV